jgi:anti-sigma factor RsiW
MNCHDIRDLEPLYLSGELDVSSRQSVNAHLKSCVTCNREINEQIRLDSRLAAVLAGAKIDSRRVEQHVRMAIASERRVHRWWAGAAIATVVAGIVSVSFFVRWKAAPAPALFAEAARDHRVEVIEKQPRHWRVAPSDIENVTVRHGLTYAQASSLAAAGYKLERAKNCGIEGQRTLHLVFGNGAREYSLYVRSDTARHAPIRVVHQKDEEVGAVETGHFRAIVVTSGSQSECETLIKMAASRL